MLRRSSAKWCARLLRWRSGRSFAFASVAVGFGTSLTAIRAAEPTAALPPPAIRAIDFVVDVRPLLAKHCLACHGEDLQESGLRLDQKQAALGGGKNGPAIQ